MSRADDEHDRGLRAVRRVREVRERDGRVGLRLALADERERAATLARLQEQRDQAQAPALATTAAFLAARETLLTLGAAVAQAEADLAPARRIAETAREHWRRDAAALSSVDSLLERRAEARQQEAAQAEARRTDETGTQLWLRGRSEQ